jgi:mannitol-1-/sugar-/sorbitol-6-phosphatase
MTDQVVRFRCDALLFDLDGVLADSTACVEHVWRTWASRHGLDPDTILRVAHGRRALDTVRSVAQHLDAAAEVITLAGQEARATDGVSPVPGAHALLQSLPRGRWAIVTSGVRAVAEHRLRLLGLPAPEVLVCADDVARGKPDPEGYLAAAAQLGFAPEDCIVIEDAPAGLQAARAAHMRVIAVATTHPPQALSDADAITSALDAFTVRVRDGDHVRLEIEISLSEKVVP